jgi:FimV-like protein
MTLIFMIIESYYSILLAIGAVSVVLFAAGLYVILRYSREKNNDSLSFTSLRKGLKNSVDKNLLPETASDVSAISGEDPLATQLDLARAYIETGKKQFAKIILTAVIREGSSDYQEEAQRLLSTI